MHHYRGQVEILKSPLPIQLNELTTPLTSENFMLHIAFTFLITYYVYILYYILCINFCRDKPFCSLCMIEIGDNTPKAIKSHIKSKPHKIKLQVCTRIISMY